MCYGKSTDYENCLNLIGRKKGKQERGKFHLASWKLISNCILNENSAEKFIFKQELQKRRRIKARDNIMQNTSARSLGRRAAYLNRSNDGPIDFKEIFEHSRMNHCKEETDIYEMNLHSNLILNKNDFSDYNFSQVSRPNEYEKPKTTIKNSKIIKLQSKTSQLKDEAKKLFTIFLKKNKELQRFKNGLHRNSPSKKYENVKSRFGEPQSLCSKTIRSNASANYKTEASSNRSARSRRSTDDRKSSLYSKKHNPCSLRNSEYFSYKNLPKRLEPGYATFLGKKPNRFIYEKCKEKVIKSKKIRLGVKRLLSM